MARLTPYFEVQSDLFRESGANASTSEALIMKYARAMRRYGSWGRFPPVRGTLHRVNESDLEDYAEAVERGYEHELAWSRPLTLDDLGLTYISLDDGHDRAYAAASLGLPLRVRVGQKNPLDPLAAYREPRPFVVQGITTRADNEGVHTALTPERAAIYAVQRAMLAESLAVVFCLDVSGLTPLSDVDARLEAKQHDPTWVLDEHEVQEAFENQDADALADAFTNLRDFAEYESADGGHLTYWTEAAIEMVDREKRDALLQGLLGLDPDTLLRAMTELREYRTLPFTVWVAVVGQQRYLTPIGLDRVVRITALRPLRNQLWSPEEREETGKDYPPDDPNQPQIFSDEDFFENMAVALPDQIVLWEQPARPGARLEYHGTDLTRAQAAFPELHLTNPWPYTQPF